jgi:hypothetical protein
MVKLIGIHQKMRSLLHTIKACNKDLEEIEKKLNKIKFQSLENKKKD